MHQITWQVNKGFVRKVVILTFASLTLRCFKFLLFQKYPFHENIIYLTKYMFPLFKRKMPKNTQGAYTVEPFNFSTPRIRPCRYRVSKVRFSHVGESLLSKSNSSHLQFYNPHTAKFFA